MCGKLAKSSNSKVGSVGNHVGEVDQLLFISFCFPSVLRSLRIDQKCSHGYFKRRALRDPHLFHSHTQPYSQVERHHEIFTFFLHFPDM